jgi:hypothetical protein
MGDHQVTRAVFGWGLPLGIGLLIGWLLDPLSEEVWSIYDSMFPVVTVQATPTQLHDGRYAVMMSGTKHRSCDLEGVFAYDVVQLQRPTKTRLTAQRIDGAMNVTIPKGSFTSSTPWVIVPPPVGKLEIWMRHRCSDRYVMTQAEVKA